MTALAVSRFTGRALQLAFLANRAYESGGFSYDITGKIRAVSSVPSPANRSNGFTFDTNGQLFVTDKALAVAPFSRSNGLTFDSRGALIVVLSGSALAPIHQSNGLAFDASGALIVTDSGSPALAAAQLLRAAGRNGRIPAHYTDAGWFRDRNRTQPWVYPADLEQQVQWVDDLTGQPRGWALGADLLGGAGSFASATGWTLSAAATISGGSLNVNSTAASVVASISVAGLTIGTRYRITASITSVVVAGGGFSITAGSVPVSGLVAATTTGVYTWDIVPTSTNALQIVRRGAGTFEGSIDNITVQEVILDQSWLGSDVLNGAGDFSSSAGWGTPTAAAITGGALAFDGTTTMSSGQTFISASPAVSIVAGRSYQVTYTIVSNTTNAISVGFSAGGVTGTPQNLPGTYTEILTATANANLSVFARLQTNIRTGSIDNITVREIPGNPSVSPSAGNGPTATARVNLLQRTEEFDNAAWSKSGSTVTQNAGTAPGGALTADKLVESTNNGAHQVSQTVTMPSGATRFTVCAKAAERSVLDIELTDNTTGSIGYRFNLSAVSAVVTGNGSGTSWTSVSGSIQSLGDGWCLCTVIGTRGAGTQTVPVMRINNGSSASYLGDGTSGILVWGADLRLSVYDSLNLPAYQRVGDGSAGVFDYDWQGFPVRLVRGAANRGLMTLGTLDLTGTDAVNVGMWVVKTSDSAVGMILETSASLSANNGAIYIDGPHTTSAATYQAASKGTSVSTVTTAANFAAPHIAALLYSPKIGTDTSALSVNGGTPATSSSDQGTGNYGNLRLFEGGRSLDSSPSLSFTGEWLPGFVVDANAIDATLAAAMLREMAARVGHIY